MNILQPPVHRMAQHSMARPHSTESFIVFRFSSSIRLSLSHTQTKIYAPIRKLSVSIYLPFAFLPILPLTLPYFISIKIILFHVTLYNITFECESNRRVGMSLKCIFLSFGRAIFKTNIINIVQNHNNSKMATSLMLYV